MELTTEELLQSIWMALRRIEDNLSLPPAPLELPPIELPRPDLAEIVNAVNGLKPGPSAEEIAAAIAATLTPTPNRDPVLDKIVEALEKLDFRMQATQAFGGGSVSLSDTVIDQLVLTSATTSVTRVAATTTPTQLGGTGTGRVAMNIYNEPGASILYLKFGVGVTTTDYSVQLGPGDYYESSQPRYTGLVCGVWAGTTGAAMVTEFLS